MQRLGLQELWVSAGVGDTTRYVPIHKHSLSDDVCTVLPAIHTLTGCDITSKFGTKLAAQKVPNAKFYLEDFGKLELDQDQILSQAEHYLVQVLKPGSTKKTLDAHAMV